MAEEYVDENANKKVVPKDHLFVLFNEMIEDPENGFWEITEEIGLFNYLRFWRHAARKRRLHYILAEYERKVVQYDIEVKQKMEEEIAANER
jgi:hypothetical protein